jgi:hypothetical protein
MNKRTVCHFSCGAASAVATKMAMGQGPVTIQNCEVVEEHQDNKRFLDDCAKWFGQRIGVLRNAKYQGSIYNVFDKVKYLKGTHGAPCTKLLKREMREKYALPGDINVFGYTAEEEKRADLAIERNPDIIISTPWLAFVFRFAQ